MNLQKDMKARLRWDLIKNEGQVLYFICERKEIKDVTGSWLFIKKIGPDNEIEIHRSAADAWKTGLLLVTEIQFFPLYSFF